MCWITWKMLLRYLYCSFWCPKKNLLLDCFCSRSHVEVRDIGQFFLTICRTWASKRVLRGSLNIPLRWFYVTFFLHSFCLEPIVVESLNDGQLGLNVACLEPGDEVSLTCSANDCSTAPPITWDIGGTPFTGSDVVDGTTTTSTLTTTFQSSYHGQQLTCNANRVGGVIMSSVKLIGKKHRTVDN